MTHRRSVALVTYETHPELTRSDSLLVAPLREHGVSVVAAPWDSPAVEWERYDAAILRSTWNYHLRPADFRAWVQRMERLGVPLWNPPAVVLWNMDKRYLRALAARGVPVIPSVWVERGEPASLAGILATQGWSKAVVKPSVGASAEGIWQSSLARAAADEPRFEAMLNATGVIVQEQVDLGALGEYSLIYFHGEFSHAVLKRPAPGRIFVQSEHGGSTELIDPSCTLRDQAARVLDAAVALAGVPLADILYARVDGVDRDGELLLMELELIEPSLFLSTHPPAAQRFADAIAWTVQG